MVDAFRPKLTLFEFENVNADASFDVVPAERLMLAALTLIEPVSTEPLSPNEMLFAFENVMAERLLDVVPAETLMSAKAVTIELPDIPNVTLFEFENTTVPDVAVCVPAASAMPLLPPVIEAKMTSAPWNLRYQPRPSSYMKA